MGHIKVFTQADKKKWGDAVQKPTPNRLPEITINQWLNALNVANTKSEQPIPPGFIAKSELRLQLGIGVVTFKDRMRELTLQGRIETRMLNRRCEDGVVRPLKFVRLKSDSERKKAKPN